VYPIQDGDRASVYIAFRFNRVVVFALFEEAILDLSDEIHAGLLLVALTRENISRDVIVSKEDIRFAETFGESLVVSCPTDRVATHELPMSSATWSLAVRRPIEDARPAPRPRGARRGASHARASAPRDASRDARSGETRSEGEGSAKPRMPSRRDIVTPLRHARATALPGRGRARLSRRQNRPRPHSAARKMHRRDHYRNEEAAAITVAGATSLAFRCIRDAPLTNPIDLSILSDRADESRWPIAIAHTWYHLTLLRQLGDADDASLGTISRDLYSAIEVT